MTFYTPTVDCILKLATSKLTGYTWHFDVKTDFMSHNAVNVLLILLVTITLFYGFKKRKFVIYCGRLDHCWREREEDIFSCHLRSASNEPHLVTNKIFTFLRETMIFILCQLWLYIRTEINNSYFSEWKPKLQLNLVSETKKTVCKDASSVQWIISM